MGQITPNISIYIPSDLETNYGQSFQAGMVNIDQHDHTGAPFKGVPIPSGGIANGAITLPKLDVSLYDKQSFTPVLEFGGASAGMVYSLQSGTYLKFGNICYVYVAIALTNKGISVGDATVTLPLAGVSFDALACNITNTTFPAGHTYVAGQISGFDSSLIAFGSGVAAVALNNTNFTNTSTFVLSGVYFIS